MTADLTPETLDALINEIHESRAGRELRARAIGAITAMRAENEALIARATRAEAERDAALAGAVKIDKMKAAKAIHDEDLMADEQHFDPDHPAGQWCLQVVDTVLAALEPNPAAHPDDAAVDRFAAAMKAKLEKKRADGRGGWEGPTCTADFLSKLLREHVEKGDPVDVANLAMMLHQRGERIEPNPTAQDREALVAATLERARKVIASRRAFLNSQLEALDIAREDAVFAICEEIIADLATPAQTDALAKLIRAAEIQGQVKAGGVFATSGAEDRWVQDGETSCQICGGSGHKDDAADSLAAVRREARAEILAAIERLPRRTEALGGQQFSYVKLEDVSAILSAAEKEAGNDRLRRSRPSSLWPDADVPHDGRHDRRIACHGRQDRREPEMAAEARHCL